MSKLRTIFHPIFIFIGIQIAWIILMATWINWYLKNSENLSALAKQLNPKLFSPEVNWVALVEGCFLMLAILAGVYIIFVYWNKQARLNQMQSNFVSSVSHELKSPLASIQLYLETLKYQEVSPQETRDFVETMLSDTDRLSGLIENILESSKSDPRSLQYQFQPVELEPFLRESVAGFERQFQEKKCRIEMEFHESPTLWIDNRTLRMVFSNLIGNALRYSPSGSCLKIVVRKNGSKFYDIEFHDEGIGLDPKDLKRIFKKFYRVQNRDTQNIEGAGLGLFIAYEIVKNHKGKIEAFSEGKEKGSKFVVSLPVKGRSHGR